MAGYFNATTEDALVAEHHEEDATKQALEGLPQIAQNFDSSIARMRAARKTLQDANPALVPEGGRKKMGAGLIEVLGHIIEYVDSCRSGSGHEVNQGKLTSEGIAARMRIGG